MEEPIRKNDDAKNISPPFGEKIPLNKAIVFILVSQKMRLAAHFIFKAVTQTNKKY